MISDRDKKIVHCAFGGWTYAQIGREFNISRERVRQIVKRRKKYKRYGEYRDYWLYILRCIDDTFYVGITQDLNIRMNQHFTGQGAVYTRKHEPVSIPFAMCKWSNRWDVLNVESFLHNNPGFVDKLVQRNDAAINLIKRIWLHY